MRNSIVILFFSLLLFVEQALYAQYAPAIEWQKNIGGTHNDWLYSIKQTTDGGYICGGWAISDFSGDKTENSLGGSDMWILKLDSSGSIVWQNTIGGTSLDDLYVLAQTYDGGYILGGSSFSDSTGDKTENNMSGIGGGYFDYWIVKVDSLGITQWQNTIGGTHDDELRTLKQTLDGGYICGGYSKSHISGDKTSEIADSDFWILKLDSSGNITWQRTIGGYSYDGCNSISQTKDGGYFCAGLSNSSIGADKSEGNFGDTDLWVVKLDSTGTIQWDKTYGGNDMEFLFYDEGAIQTNDGGYILGSASQSNISGNKTENSFGDWDYWILKLDSTGTIQWQRTLGGSAADLLWSINQGADGGYYCGGNSRSGISGNKTENNRGESDYWILKLDATSNIQWQKTLGGSELDNLNYISQTRDFGFICGGRSESDYSGDKTSNNWDPSFSNTNDFWIIKLYPDSTVGVSEHPTDMNFHLAPQPLVESSILTFTNANKNEIRCTLFDITGREIEIIYSFGNEITIERGTKNPGIYFYSLENMKSLTNISGKIIVAGIQ